MVWPLPKVDRKERITMSTPATGLQYVDSRVTFALPPQYTTFWPLPASVMLANISGKIVKIENKAIMVTGNP
jgi:hypothetical protein